MKISEINAVVRYFDELVTNPDPMPNVERILLRKLADLYEWEMIKKEAHGCIMKLAKARDKGLW